MKPRYVIVDEVEREKFEKRWHMPYGYADARIYMNPVNAVNALNDIVELEKRHVHIMGSPVSSDLIVEKISKEGRELYYRI